MNRIAKAIVRNNYQNLVAIGAANGTANRARQFKSTKEKANCPKRQRKTWRYEGD